MEMLAAEITPSGVSIEKSGKNMKNKATISEYHHLVYSIFEMFLDLSFIFVPRQKRVQ